MYKRYTKKMTGFTLAETLVTLAVIGIVAALTIPSLLNSYNKSQYVVKLKKTVSLLTDATKSIMSDKGVSSFNQTGIMGDEDWRIEFDKMGEAYATKLNVLKYCNDETGNQGCFQSNIILLNGNIDSANETDMDILDNWTSDKVITADGVSIAFWSNAAWGGCSPICGGFHVDINALAPPNQIGRDVFALELYNDGRVMPRDYTKTMAEINNSCNTSSVGFLCAAKIAKEGWKMNY